MTKQGFRRNMRRAAYKVRLGRRFVWVSFEVPRKPLREPSRSALPWRGFLLANTSEPKRAVCAKAAASPEDLRGQGLPIPLC